MDRAEVQPQVHKLVLRTAGGALIMVLSLFYAAQSGNGPRDGIGKVGSTSQVSLTVWGMNVRCAAPKEMAWLAWKLEESCGFDAFCPLASGRLN